MELNAAIELVTKTLDDGKARDIQVIDVTGLASFTDCMVVATGTSTTHVKALGGMVEQAFKEANDPCLGAESGPQPEWMLVDHGNIVIHVMTEQARAYYSLEKLWQVKDDAPKSVADSSHA